MQQPNLLLVHGSHGAGAAARGLLAEDIEYAFEEHLVGVFLVETGSIVVFGELTEDILEVFAPRRTDQCRSEICHPAGGYPQLCTMLRPSSGETLNNAKLIGSRRLLALRGLRRRAFP